MRWDLRNQVDRELCCVHTRISFAFPMQRSERAFFLLQHEMDEVQAWLPSKIHCPIEEHWGSLCGSLPNPRPAQPNPAEPLRVYHGAPDQLLTKV